MATSRPRLLSVRGTPRPCRPLRAARRSRMARVLYHWAAAWQLVPILRRILRHKALGDDRMGLCHGAARLPAAALRRPKRHAHRSGPKLFEDLACVNCHMEDGSGHCPSLRGLFGHTVLLSGGSTVTADEAYIRESILNPAAKVCRDMSRSCRPSRGR
jgi:hypothetical protein